MNLFEQVQSRVTKVIKAGTSLLLGKAKRVELFILKQRRLQRHPVAAFQCLKGAVRKIEADKG